MSASERATAARNTAEGPGFGVKRLLDQSMLLAMRIGGTAAKFLLAIYTARFLGLADLGIYGLLVGATTFVPALVGLGMTDWTVRRIVDLPRSHALPMVASCFSLTVALHLLLQPLAFAVNIVVGKPIPLEIMALCGAILLLENLAMQATDMLIARRRIFLGYFLHFLRLGFWPIPIMAIGLLFPETRTLEFLLLGWLAMLVVTWVILGALALQGGRWRLLRPQWDYLRKQLPGSFTLYVKDVSFAASNFLDRFLISLFLGLELTGVYTLFWSIGNVVNSLAVYGVLQSQLPHVIAAGQSENQTAFRALERRLQIEISSWAVLLALAAAIVTPILVPLLNQPLVQDYMPVFWFMLGATLLRVAAESYSYVLLALNLDRMIAVIAFVGALVSAIGNLVLTPLAGLWGAAAAYALTSGGLFAARFYVSRQAKVPAAAAGEVQSSVRQETPIAL